MPSASFETSITIAETPQHIYEYVRHPTHFVRLQPLISDIYHIEEGHNQAGHTTYRYEATEQMTVLGLRLNNHLRALMTLVEPGRVLQQEAVAPMGVRVKQVLTLTAIEGGAEVLNQIEVSAHRLLLNYTIATAKKAHSALLIELKQRVEAS
jgi:hypothetical protein